MKIEYKQTNPNSAELCEHIATECDTAILEWDPDFTKVTPEEAQGIEEARAEYERGEYVRHEDINWD